MVNPCEGVYRITLLMNSSHFSSSALFIYLLLQQCLTYILTSPAVPYLYAYFSSIALLICLLLQQCLTYMLTSPAVPYLYTYFSSSALLICLLLQQCLTYKLTSPHCLTCQVHLTWLVCVMGGKCPRTCSKHQKASIYSSCLTFSS